MSRPGKLCLVFLFSISFAPLVRSQTVSGSIHGRVMDVTQAVIPDVKVTARNQETGLTRQVFSDETGFYLLQALPPGIYTVMAETVGFKCFQREDVQVTVGKQKRVDADLEIGDISDIIMVIGGETMVDSRGAEISALVDDRRITDLPLNGRNVMKLAELLPGVSGV